ncbi:hypothetical protein ACFL38_02020 [Candidatus Omnitrophota bacterium]
MRNISRIIAIAVFSCAVMTSSVSAKEEQPLGLSFEVPAPAESTLEGKHVFTMSGRAVRALAYKSEMDDFTIFIDYRQFFRKEGFKQVEDAMFNDKKTRRIRYRKQNLVIDITLTPTDTGTDVGVAKYVLPPHIEKLEELPMSVKDTFFPMPKEDQGDSDLSSIPRPPDSIRWASVGIKDSRLLTYATTLSVHEVKDFYVAEMEQKGWYLDQEFDIGKIARQLKKQTGRDVTGLRSLKIPLLGAENLERIVTDGVQLDFSSSQGTAQINISPNYIDRKLGTIIQISYNEVH